MHTQQSKIKKVANGSKKFNNKFVNPITLIKKLESDRKLLRK